MMLPTDRQIETSLSRLMLRLFDVNQERIEQDPACWVEFKTRVERIFPRLFSHYFQLYASRYDFFFHLEDLMQTMWNMWFERPEDLKKLDLMRENSGDWFQSNHMVGGVAYVDLFADNLVGICQKIPYFKELGLTYLHLMPLFRVPEGENDGGYAVSNYREVDPLLGTMDELTHLADELRKEGISMVVDFVFNHTSNEHSWALRAINGEEEYQDYYWIFSDRKMPDAYEKYLREIFPDEHPGAFTFSSQLGKWVWTTFHSYQWDLNYSNPAVFNRMAEEMLFLANRGVEVLRLDAVAFIWKKLGTNCENLPEAHTIIQAYNAVARIAAPALLFKSEAIVHPDEVVKYIRPDECQLSYNPLLMALLWESLATRKVTLLEQALRERFNIHPECAWVNYVRCHDDIGWTFSDEDALRLGVHAFDHRRFLNAYYTGRFEGSFARGLPFQENPKTGDVRISGTCASLAGLEKALREETANEVELAVRRILLIHGIILTIGGIPLIYLGDEIGTLNDYSYRDDPAKAEDSRWVHRPSADWECYAHRDDPATIEGRIYQGIKRLIQLRVNSPALWGMEMQVINSENPNVLGFVRTKGNQRVLILANFSEQGHILPANVLRLYGLGYEFTDLLSKERHSAKDIQLNPYDFRALSI